jgi:hypothetical protein
MKSKCGEENEKQKTIKKLHYRAGNRFFVSPKPKQSNHPVLDTAT